MDTSNPRIRVVTHKDIFKDQSALPTFSSPAIEFNIHHIPDLSDYFIYFNDDVFLGSPVQLSDFMTLTDGQVLFGSWEVPECAEKCIAYFNDFTIGRYSQLGNGYCDFPCNVESCGYDFGDCKPKEQTPRPEMNDIEDSGYEALIPLASTVSTVENAPPKRFCRDACGLQWLNDGVCYHIQSYE